MSGSFHRLVSRIRFFLLPIFLLVVITAQANEGSLAPQLLYGQLSGPKDFHTFAGGWLMGGDESWRAGAAAYGLTSLYYEGGRKVRLYYGGPIVYRSFSLNQGVSFHIGGLVGGGFLHLVGASKSAYFWSIEPSALLAFQITHWMGIGFSASYRYIPEVESEGITFEYLRGGMIGLSLILGQI